MIPLHGNGLSHSETCGSIGMCPSPQLIAAYHVLLRLWEPRHPPYALLYFLVCFNYLIQKTDVFMCWSVDVFSSKRKTTITPYQSIVLCCVLLLQYVKELLAGIRLLNSKKRLTSLQLRRIRQCSLLINSRWTINLLLKTVSIYLRPCVWMALHRFGQ